MQSWAVFCFRLASEQQLSTSHWFNRKLPVLLSFRDVLLFLSNSLKIFQNIEGVPFCIWNMLLPPLLLSALTQEDYLQFSSMSSPENWHFCRVYILATIYILQHYINYKYIQVYCIYLKKYQYKSLKIWSFRKKNRIQHSSYTEVPYSIKKELKG